MQFVKRDPEIRCSLVFLRWLLALLLLMTVPPATAQKSPNKETPQARLAKAEAMFQERCKTAGEKIYRTAEKVEGVLLMKIARRYKLRRSVPNG